MNRSLPQGQFQKPENAHRRAKELAAVGNPEDALALCGNVMANRKFKNANTLHIMESIALLGLAELSVQLKDLKSARDILINYRSMTQTAATSSLEKVVREFRGSAEKLVQESKTHATKTQEEEVEDLEALDTPDNALRKALKPKEQRDQEKKEREVLENIRFLWETYKQVLDVFKTNGKTEDLYNETAQRALQFCLDNKRTNEFKKLCDMLRNNYQNLFKRMQPNGTYPPHTVNPTDKDTIARTIETRCIQLKVAADLGLWKECFLTAEDLYSLMTKTKRPPPKVLAQYYEFLSQICWKSGSFLFHAFACVRNYTLYKTNQKNFGAEEKQRMATLAVLATMCVGLTGEDETSVDQTQLEKLKKMATLFNVATIPTKSTLKTDLQIREILLAASPAAQKLYQLLELGPRTAGTGTQMYPKDICAKCRPLLDEIKQIPEMETYCNQLLKVIFFRLLSQVSKVYSTMSVTQLKNLCAPVVDFPTAEKWMISAARDSGIHVQLDYVRSVVVFANKQMNDLSMLRQPLVNMGRVAVRELEKVYPGLWESRKASQRSDLFQALKDATEREAKDIERRVNEIERRNKEKADHEREQNERKVKQETLTRQREQREAAQRLEHEKKRRMEEAAKARRNDIDKRRKEDILEETKKLYHDSNPKIGDYNLNDIGEAELDKLDVEFLEEERKRIIQKDRQEKIRLRKAESKRVDHLARAMKQQTAAKIPGFAETQLIEEQATFAQIEKEQMELAKAEFEKNVEKKKLMMESIVAVKKWQEEHIGKKQVEYQQKLRDRQRVEWDKKCTRAIRRYMDDMEKKELAEARRLEEEEMRKQQEEIERKEAEEMEAREAEREKEREKRAEEMKRSEEQRREREAQAERNRPAKANGGSNWRDEMANGKANGGGFGGKEEGAKGGFSGKGRRGFENKGGDKEERDFGNLRDRRAEDNKFASSKPADKDGGKGKKSEKRGDGGKASRGDMDDWRGGGGGGPRRQEEAAGQDAAPPSQRPEPEWKKFAREKKEREKKEAGGESGA
ncbi:unnamed protein product [Amoebophrya sp. A25]|nr:unnamed protein product [Amoebophrya sp. A25]|eukprot:GSA25T00013247001.1